MAGIFTISLDYELHWGVFDKKDIHDRKTIYENTLRLIPRMLDLFTGYGVHVTWATVGSMFAQDLADWKRLKPRILPNYLQKTYSAYNWINSLEDPEQHQQSIFSPETIGQIQQSHGQELATHTFSHYYCLEQQSGPEAFEHDLMAVVRAGRRYDARIVSLVFPRNQFNPAYLKTCYQNGIRVVRTNPDVWFWKPVKDKGAGFIKKVFRTGDAYIPVSNARTSYPLSSIRIRKEEPLQLPASRFYRAWTPKLQFASGLHLDRVCSEMTKAAIHNECYHLWFHPENIGDHPEENMRNLLHVVKCFKACQERYGMISWNMSEYAKNLLDGNERHTRIADKAVI